MRRRRSCFPSSSVYAGAVAAAAAAPAPPAPLAPGRVVVVAGGSLVAAPGKPVADGWPVADGKPVAEGKPVWGGAARARAGAPAGASGAPGNRVGSGSDMVSAVLKWWWQTSETRGRMPARSARRQAARQVGDLSAMTSGTKRGSRPRLRLGGESPPARGLARWPLGLYLITAVNWGSRTLPAPRASRGGGRRGVVGDRAWPPGPHAFRTPSTTG